MSTRQDPRWQGQNAGGADRIRRVTPLVAIVFGSLLPVLFLSESVAVSTVRPEPPGNRCWELTVDSPDRLVLTVTIVEPHWAASSDAGRLVVPGFHGIDEIGGSLWPTLHLPVALPPEGDYRIDVEVTGERELLLPPELSLSTADREVPPREERRGEGDDPSWASVDQGGYVETRRPAVSDYLRILPLRIRPLRRATGGGWIAPRQIRIDLRFSDRQQVGSTADRAARPARERPVLRAVVNPRQAAGWRAAPPARRALARGDGYGSATSDWVRINITRRGIYAITATDLGALGIDPAEIDPAGVRLFCADAGAIPESLAVDQLPEWMEPCAVHIEDDGDGIWDSETRLYFVGNGPDGWRSDLGLATPLADERYYAHPHSPHFTYWLCWEGEFDGEPLRVEERDASPGGLPLRETGVGRVHVERNREYDTRPRQEGAEWQQFFDVLIRSGKTGSATVSLPGLRTGRPATLRASVWGASWDLYQDGDDHFARVAVNGDSVASAMWDNLDQAILVGSIPEAETSNAVTVSVPVRTEPGGGSVKDNIYLAWVEMDYAQRLETESDSLAFFISADSLVDHGLRISGLGSADGWLLLDASAFRNPVRLVPQISAADEGYTAEFHLTPAGEEAHLVLLQRADAAAPAALERVTWHRDGAEPLLRDRTAAIDYIVITTAELWEAATALQAHRTQYYPGAGGDTLLSGRVAVVDVERIFDEFAWGQHDPTALRSFLVQARERWRGAENEPTLAHLLLLGNAYYDPRDHFQRAIVDMVPSHHEYEWYRQTNPSWSPAYFRDDWFTYLDGPEDEAADIAVGRLPAGTAQQAVNMVDKIIDYDTNAPPGEWRTHMTLAADDICQGPNPDPLGWDHTGQTELLSTEAIPPDARQRKIYLVEYGRDCIYDRKPAATADLLETIAEGTLLFDFVGHGSEIQLADERLMERATVPTLQNYDKPFLMITASCAVGKFAHGGDGLGLNVIRLAGRGALAVLSASSMASSTINFTLNSLVLQAMFPSGNVLEPIAFGSALLGGKVQNSQDNDRRYNLFGDPASRFVVPQYRIELSLEDVPGISGGADTLMRGGGATVAGTIRDLDGNAIPDFDGEARIVVLDSDIHRSPRPEAPGNDYHLPGARIFSGTAEVSAGEFRCPFFVPTALRTGTRGPARVYAHAQGVEMDASGALVEVWIPEEVLQSGDVDGPEITLEWQNAGGPVSPGSVLSATLKDSSGIYVAALAPSRSVVVTISDDAERILVASDLAERVVFGEDFREAAVDYSIPEGLPTGQPLTLALEASDNLNHRSRAALEFVLEGAGAGEACLGMAFALPNPMDGETRFLFDLAAEADLELVVFTASGRRIREFSVPGMSPVQARESGIYWDGRDADGDRLANGVYFFRVVARDCQGRRGERIERLVVLR